MAGINTNNTQWGNFQSDDVKNLNDIYRWIKKLESVISDGFQGNGGWTDAGATVKLTTATDSVGIGTASPLTKLHVLHDTEAVAFFQSSTDSYVKIQSGNNLGAALLLTDGTDEATVGFNVATSTLILDAGGDGIELASSGVVTIPNLGGSGTGIVAVDNDGVLSFTTSSGFTTDVNDNAYYAADFPGAGTNLIIGVPAAPANQTDTTATVSIAIGQVAQLVDGAVGAVVIGPTASAGGDGIAIGFGAAANGTEGAICISTNSGSADTNSIAIGSGAFSNTGELVFANGNNVLDEVWFGKTNTPTSVSFNIPLVTGVTATNQRGADFIINVGGATGDANTGSDFIVATPDTGSTGTTYQTFTNKFIIKKSGDIQIPSKTINSTAGDSATIDSNCGRFRKDTSGSTFTLTNSRITANSIVLTQITTTGLTTGNECIAVAGSGSCVFTFQTSLLGAAAPSANCDVNFWVIN